MNKTNGFVECNFDGLVGPTHNYAGLAAGNVASISNINTESDPKSAALQGLAKMKQLSDLGLAQAVLPPQPRPDINFLKNLGFTGSIENILKQAQEKAPRLFCASYSASAMWTANAATVTPSYDSSDNKVHFTPANLSYNVHRTLEAEYSYNILSSIFNNTNYFKVHKYLPMSPALGDEGAANHTRFCSEYNETGVGLFVYGKEFYNNKLSAKKYPARQTLEASEAIVRQHGLDFVKTIFIQQNPMVIDAGVFHNDVCAVGNKNVLLCHEQAFVEQEQSLNNLKRVCDKNNIDLNIYQVSTKDLSLNNMVSSYLFNSQLVSLSPDRMALIAPKECQDNKQANSVINNIIADNNTNIDEVIYVDCKQSMQNGGGPACLRLRVVLSKQELENIGANIILTDELYNKLEQWINMYYRDSIKLTDLLDPLLLKESNLALKELYSLLNISGNFTFS